MISPRLNRGTLQFTVFLIGTIFASGLQGQELQVDQQDLDRELKEQVALLGNVSYRVRQLARWRLEQYPIASTEVVRKTIAEVDHNTGAQLVDLLTVFATQPDVEISLTAIGVLRQTANKMSSVGRLAKNSLTAITDLQEEQAIEILVHHDARVGSPQFTINGQRQSTSEMSLHIDERFTGDQETLHWIRFLKSIETIYFEGPKINSDYFQAISELKGVRNIKLRHIAMTHDDLRILKRFSNLEHLGLNYIDLDDSVVDTLAELPLSDSLRLFGTRITQEGATRLQQQLDDVDIYCGRGGFLGISTGTTNTIVRVVTSNSGALRAGIKVGDRLTHINQAEIKTFDDIRKELSKCFPNETLEVELMRGNEKLRLSVTLSEDQS